MKNPLSSVLTIIVLLFSPSIISSQDCVLYNTSYNVISDLGHSVGSEWWLNSDLGGWAAFTDSDNAGFLTYGPYDSSGPEGLRQVNYELLVADNNGNNLVFTIDVWDATTGQQMASQDIYQDWFSGGVMPQLFTLSYYHTEGHSMEYRVWFHDTVIGAITGLSVTNDSDNNGLCDCYGDTDGDGLCNEWTYPNCSVVDMSLFSNSMSFNGSNYYLSSGSYTWEEANALAIEQGGHLVTISSEAENTFVSLSMGQNSPWIGLYQDENSDIRNAFAINPSSPVKFFKCLSTKLILHCCRSALNCDPSPGTETANVVFS